ncbi:MAG: hypothetical protein R2862_12225 [Thermoanaerobaculia bacterium]
MNQPLGDWAGHAAEIGETLEILEGGGPPETVELTLALAGELGSLLGVDLSPSRLRPVLASGAAREQFARWAVEQGARADWFENPDLPLAPVEKVVLAGRDGVVRRACGTATSASSSRRSGRRPAGGRRRARRGSRCTIGPGSAAEWRRGRSWRASISAARTPDSPLVSPTASRSADDGATPPLIHEAVRVASAGR